MISMQKIGLLGVVALLLQACAGGASDAGDPTHEKVIPETPQDFSASPADGTVTLKWLDVDGATSYTIHMASESGINKDNYRDLNNGMKHENVTSPFTHPAGLTNGKTYYFVVTASNSVGESNESTLVAATPEPVTDGVPKDVSAAAADGQVTIQWPDVAGATSYNIYWSNSDGVTKSNGTKIEDVTSPYVHKNLYGETMYFYVVTAAGNQGESSESAQVAAKTPPSIPPPPQTITATPGDTTVIIDWGEVQGATSYNLYMASETGVSKTNYNSLPSGSGMRHVNIPKPFTHTGLTNGTTYYFALTSVNELGESELSAEVTATPTAP